jgi:hypothetical protein
MSALEKTENLIRVRRFPLHLMVKNEKNPNKMKAREFDLLCDNMNETGWTDPVLARPLDYNQMKALQDQAEGDEGFLVELMRDANALVRIVGGHHRYDAATFLGFTDGPVTIIMDSEFDEEKENFQLVRMNTIHGKLDPQAFFDMYNGLAEKYTDAVLQEAFGFAEEAEFKKLIAQTAKLLPDKASQEKFKKEVAVQEIKTVDGLAKLLNSMFSRYGDTLPYGFMIFDYGGQRSMWLRITEKTMKALDVIGDICIDKNRTVDDFVGSVLQLIANGESQDFIDSIVAETPEVKLPANLQAAPTKEHLDKVDSLS